MDRINSSQQADQEITIQLTEEHIKLDAAIKLAGLTDSGGQAKQLIKAGSVKVNGTVETQRGRKLRRGDRIQVTRSSLICIVLE